VAFVDELRIAETRSFRSSLSEKISRRWLYDLYCSCVSFAHHLQSLKYLTFSSRSKTYALSINQSIILLQTTKSINTQTHNDTNR